MGSALVHDTVGTRVDGEEDEAEDNHCPDTPDLGIEIGARVVVGDLKYGVLRFYGR